MDARLDINKCESSRNIQHSHRIPSKKRERLFAGSHGSETGLLSTSTGAVRAFPCPVRLTLGRVSAGLIGFGEDVFVLAVANDEGALALLLPLDELKTS